MSEDTLSEREIAIRARTAAGLTRQQAEQVQDTQEASDAALAKASKSKKEKPAE